jgi:hypothetical protein
MSLCNNIKCLTERVISLDVMIVFLLMAIFTEGRVYAESIQSIPCLYVIIVIVCQRE